MSERDQALIADWGERLSVNGLAKRVLATLGDRKAEVERCALDGLQRENAQFARAASPQFRAEALGHCNDILQLMLAIATGVIATSEPFHFVERHAMRRARQQFPLAGSLNAYRLAHKGYWEVMRNAVIESGATESERTHCLMVLSEFMLEFFDRISCVMTDTYLAEEKVLVRRRTRTQAALVDDLLAGRQPGDLEAQALCNQTGIGNGIDLSIALGRVRPPADMSPPEQAKQIESLAEFVRQVLSQAGTRNLVERRKDDVIAIIVADTRASRSATEALRTIDLELAGCCAIGISMQASDIAALPQALQEAERAIEFTSAERPVMQFSEIDLMEFLVRRPDATAQRLIPSWASRLKAADGAKAGALSNTIRQFAACNFNVKHTARQLRLHTNTVYFRLNRVRELTGVDPRSYSGLSLLLTTLQMIDGGRPQQHH